MQRNHQSEHKSVIALKRSVVSMPFSTDDCHNRHAMVHNGKFFICTVENKSTYGWNKKDQFVTTLSSYDIASGQLIKSFVLESQCKIRFRRCGDFILLQADSYALSSIVLTSDLEKVTSLVLKSSFYGGKFDASSQFLANSHGTIIYINKIGDIIAKEINIFNCKFVHVGELLAFCFTRTQDILVLAKTEITEKCELSIWQYKDNQWIKSKSSFIQFPVRTLEYHIIILSENQAVIILPYSHETFFVFIDMHELSWREPWKLDINNQKPRLLNAKTIIAIDGYDRKQIYIIDLQHRQYQKIQTDSPEFCLFDIYPAFNHLAVLLCDDKKEEKYCVQHYDLESELSLTVAEKMSSIFPIAGVRKIITEYCGDDFPLVWQANRFAPWGKLNDLIRRYILKFLDFDDVTRFQCASRFSKKLGQDPIVWRAHFHCHFVPLMKTCEETEVKSVDYYREFRTNYRCLIEKMPKFKDQYMLRRFKENKFDGFSKYQVSVNADHRDHLGFPYAYWALKNNHQERLDWIYEYGASPRKAIFCNQKKAILDFCSTGGFREYKNHFAYENATPLTDAISMGQLDVVEALLPLEDEFKDIIVKGVTKSPLAYAVWLGHFDIAMFLLNQIKHLNKLSCYKDSLELALLAAATKNNINMVELLLAAGANVFFTNYNNETPFECTTDKDIKRLLLCAELDPILDAASKEKKPAGILSFFKPKDMELAAEFKCALQTGREQEFLAKYRPSQLPEKIRIVYFKAQVLSLRVLTQRVRLVK